MIGSTMTDGIGLLALDSGKPDAGNTAWVLISVALVMLMTPGLAFFYGGMVRAKSVLNMMMMSFSALGIVAVLWVIFGFSAAFGESWGGLLGDPTEFFGLNGIFDGGQGGIPLVGSIPAAVFVMFQMMFAAIAVALVSGAVADRMKFCAWVLLVVLWATFTYFPVANWVFSFDGLVSESGGWIASGIHAIDFAGGTAVHINAGIAALVVALFLGARHEWRSRPPRPHNLTLVMIGAALLWFGWVGFNAGSALAADGAAASVLVNTVLAAGTGMLAWIATEHVRDGHSTTLGAASGVVAGLVGITPACASVGIWGSTIVGIACGVLCALAVGLKFRLGVDDSLDVVGVHLVGGIVGTLLVGFVATSSAPTGVDGLFYGGGFDQLWRQAVGAAAVMAYSAVVTTIIVLIIRLITGLRVDHEHEVSGIDLAVHAETAYDFGHTAGRPWVPRPHTGTTPPGGAVVGGIRHRDLPSLIDRSAEQPPRPERTVTENPDSSPTARNGGAAAAAVPGGGLAGVQLVTAVVRPTALGTIRTALDELDVHGLTVTEVSGQGRQRGHTEVYRSSEIAVDLVTKLKLEVITESRAVDQVVDAIVSAARSDSGDAGAIGDGKVWVGPLGRVVRVRTGEEGMAAV